MSTTTRAEQTHPPGLPRAYVGAWAVMAAISGLYLTGVALLPAENGRVPLAARSEHIPASLELAEARAIKLKVTLEDFQRDLAHLRNGADRQPQDQGLLARLAALEERLSIETGIPVAKTAAPQPATAPVAAVTTNAPAAAAAPAATASADQRPGGPRVAGALATVVDGETRISIPLETGSLQKVPGKPELAGKDLAGRQASPPVPPSASGQSAAAPSPAIPAILNAAPAPAAGTAAGAGGFAPVVTPAPAPAPKPFAVQLASGGSIDTLRFNWSILTEQHGDTLRSLQPRVTSSATPDAGPIYDLQAGPFKTAADARKACKALASRGVDCKVASFGGEAL